MIFIMYKTKKSLFSLIVGSCFVFIGIAAVAGEEERKETLTIGLQSSDLQSLDPAISYEWSNSRIVASLNAGLLRWDSVTSSAQLDLAKSYKVVDDGHTILFELHEDIYFHNNRRIVADDFVFSFERIVNPKTRSPFQIHFEQVLGYEEYLSGESANLAGVEALSDTQFRIRLSRPDSNLINVLSQWVGSVVPREDVTRDNFDQMPVGAGPYRMSSNEDKKLILRKFRRYIHLHEEAVELVNVIIHDSGLYFLRGVQIGEIDYAIVFQPTPELLHYSLEPPYSDFMRLLDVHSVVYLSFNMRNGALTDNNLRKAINHAINKDALLHDLYFGMVSPTSRILPPELSGLTPPPLLYDYNEEKAISMAKKSLGTKKIELSMLLLNSTINFQAAEKIASDLAKLGITIRFVAVDESEFLKLAADKDIDITFSDGMAWIADYPDPSNFYFPLFAPKSYGSGYNWSGYSDSDIHKRAIEISTLMGDKQKSERQERWDELLDDIQTEDAPWAPLFNRKLLYIVSPNLRGYLYSDIFNVGTSLHLQGLYSVENSKH